MASGSIEFVFSLKRKQETKTERWLSIKVVGRDSKGELKPIAGAKIRWDQDSFTTNAKGSFGLIHNTPIGEQILLYAEAEGYEPASESLIVGKGRTNLTRMKSFGDILDGPDGREFSSDRRDYILITMEKAVRTVVKIVVLDEATDKPIEGASVNLELNGKSNGKTTNSAGEAVYELDEQPANVRAVARVSKSEYIPKWSDVPSDYLRAKDDPSAFTVFLKKEAVTVCEWIVYEAGWTGTWIRVGTSNQFKAVWTHGSSESFTSNVTLSISGSSVTGRRQDDATNQGMAFEYEGTITADGTSASGVRRRLLPQGGKGWNYDWTAVINCGKAPSR